MSTAELFQLLGNVGEFVGAIAVVATLFYLAVQVRQSKEATQANTRSLEQARELALNDAGFNLVNARTEFNNMIVRHADIWLRGNAGEPLEPVEAQIYRSLVETKWANVFWEAFTINSLHDQHNIPLHDFAAFLAKNPGARATWDTFVQDEQHFRDRLLDGYYGVRIDKEANQVVLDDLARLNGEP